MKHVAGNNPHLWNLVLLINNIDIVGYQQGKAPVVESQVPDAFHLQVRAQNCCDHGLIEIFKSVFWNARNIFASYRNSQNSLLSDLSILESQQVCRIMMDLKVIKLLNLDATPMLKVFGTLMLQLQVKL